ncbi:hypothetical protein TWF191_009680 [Orbilia oligospora]|uniref:Uncharacterized protein n=1 Tax=Orbilia oligospora TaxID=2813651 RepID=A0A7C8UNT3_ORBOL|nr:hypothetical protein TWF191_009680 [Orbilia oligospora]
MGCRVGVKYTGKHSTNNYKSLKNQQLRVKFPDNMSANGPFGGCVPIQEVQPPPAEIPHQEEPAPPPQENQQYADDYNGADNVQGSYDYSY